MDPQGPDRGAGDGREPTPPRQASTTIGRARPEPPGDAAPTIGQTLRDAGSPGGRKLADIGLSELNASHQRFKLLRPHAKGGLGVVSVAHDVELDREVAVKEMRLESLSDDAVQRFMMEARVTGQLDHPGIPPVYALGYFDDGRPFYVMRLIEGVTLKRAVEDFHKRFPQPDTSRQRSLELRKLLGAFVSVCHTLRYAHSRHVLHRDIKPSNIMLGNFGETLVLDWGLAKCREESLPYSELEAKAHQSKRRYDDPTLTGTGSVLGTPHYMSPEQARGQWDSVNLRSEVYSLGATLYTILTGRLPFSGTTREAVLEQVRQGNCRRPKDVDPRIPAELDAICIQAMALNREDRFATAGELASEIEHWLADEPVSSYRETSARRWLRWLKSHQTALGMLMALLATGLVAVVVGAFAVSYEHARAKEALAQAAEQKQRAEASYDAARYFIGRFLTLNYNDIFSQIPGSEVPRLTLLDEALGQLKQWALDNPADPYLKFDVAEAYRERSRLWYAMNQPEKAWADLALSLDIIEDLAGAPDTPLHQRLVVTRLYALNETATLIEDKYGASATLGVLMSARKQAEQLWQQNIDDVRRRVAFFHLNSALARQLHSLGRRVEAAELIDGAVAQFEAMLVTLNEKTLEEKLHSGLQTLELLTCEARQLQASIAYSLEDYAFAASCLERSEQLCRNMLQQSPNATPLLTIQLDSLALRAELSLAWQPSEQALKEVRQSTDEILQVAERFPSKNQFKLAGARAELRLAIEELDAGSLARATTAVASAVGALEQLCSQPDAKPTWQLELTRALRVRAESALLAGSPDVAAAHCRQAQATLAAAAHAASGLEGVAAEARQLGLLESQVDALR